ncbi:MAG: hypothetical protein HQL35_09095 [Alphaproteobacteria bacterium]|nr:hypothetical protein [Alphaproteobacteria bacterium]
MRAFIAAFLIAAASATPGLAQTATTVTTTEPTATATPGMVSPKVEIRMRAPEITEIPLNAPQAIDLGSLSVPGASKDLTDGVTVKAFTRYVEYEGRKIGQIVLAGVEKDGQVEPLPTVGFSAQFDLTAPELVPNTDVVVEGDQAAILAALERLAEAAPKEATPEEVQITNDDNNAQKQDAGGSAPQNEQASSWQSPEPVQVSESGESITVTKNGCQIRPDIAQMRAFQQTKTVSMKNGAITAESECSDSHESFPIDRSYFTCPYDEDTDPAVRTATAQYGLYYVDNVGNKVDVPFEDGSDCKADPEKIFPITEKTCPILLDYTDGAETAVPQSSLVYLNDNNKEVPVRGCQASESKPAVAMTPIIGDCGMRDDFSNNKSFQLGTFTYVLDGITYQAGGCTENGSVYAHKKAYTDLAGELLCPAVKDQDGKPTALQSRIEITVDGLPQYRTLCAPDTGGEMAITATTETCDNPVSWDHDINAGISYGQERFYFTENGQRRWITGCQNSQTTYPHDVTIAGWDAHDDQLFAYPKSTVTIYPPYGRYDVVVNQVLSGAVQMPYEKTGTVTRETGVPLYPDNSCNKFVQTAEFELWKRPDTTTFERQIGEGTPVGPSYGCVRQGGLSPSDWTAAGKSVGGTNTSVYNTQDNLYVTYCSGYSVYGQYSTTSRIVRQDGLVVSTQDSGLKTVSGAQGGAGGHAGGCDGSYGNSLFSGWTAPTPPPTSDVTRWLYELGWM